MIAVASSSPSAIRWVCLFVALVMIAPNKDKEGIRCYPKMSVIPHLNFTIFRVWHGMYLHDAVDLYISSLIGVLADTTVSTYQDMLNYLERGLPKNAEIDRITITDLRNWRRSLIERDTKQSGGYGRVVTGNLSPWTVHSAIKICKIFFKWLVAEGYLKENPAKRLESVKLPKPTRTGVDDDVVDLFIQEAKSNARDLALVLFIRDTGCRRGGAATVMMSDLSLYSKDERIQRRVRVVEKGNKERFVFLKERSLKALKMWLEVRPNYAAPGIDNVFVSISNDDKGQPLKPNGITQIFRRLSRKTGVKKPYSPHQWRHRYARKLISKGANLKQVSEALGHNSITVTSDFYGSLTIDQIQDAIDKFLPDDEPDFDY